MGGGREREGKREEGLLEAEGVGVKRCWRRRSVSLVDIVGGLSGVVDEKTISLRCWSLVAFIGW